MIFLTPSYNKNENPKLIKNKKKSCYLFDVCIVHSPRPYRHQKDDLVRLGSLYHERIADISRPHPWSPRKMTSEEGKQKFNSDDVSLPISEQCF